MEEIVAQRVKVKQVSIYALTDPFTDEIRYIGKAVNVKARYAGHLRDSANLEGKKKDYPVYRWIRALKSSGKLPSLKVIAVCHESNWRETEIGFIAEERAKGSRLLNVANGGDQPYCSKEVRIENGRKNAKTRVDDPWKAYIWKLKFDVSHLLKQGYGTNEDRALLRNAAKVRPDLFACYANLKDLEEGSEAYRKAYPSKYMSDELNLKYEQGKRAYREKAKREAEQANSPY